VRRGWLDYQGAYAPFSLIEALIGAPIRAPQ
jgi:hypothetical protein